MMQAVTWHSQRLVWKGSRWPQLTWWAPHVPMHPACDPRNDPPPEGWHWLFLMQAEQESEEVC